ncbi:MAG: tetratricopeptide repeat protein [Deltaproteobacteria bacterium]|nr:tetratricopeptide repeat protein [Deltaproteobacteria bacterium]
MRLALFLVGAGLVLGACKEDPGTVAVREADRLYREQSWEAAAVAYAALPETSGDWKGYGAWRAGVIYRDPLGDPRRATLQFTLCAREYAETSTWGYTCLVELGDLARDEGNPRGAIDSYRKSLELRPSGQWSEHCLFESGRAYQEIGEYEQSRKEWTELLSRFERSTRAAVVMLAIARSFDLQGQGKEARRAFRAVHRTYPKHSVAPLAIFGEAEVLEQMGEFETALKLYEKVQTSHPNPQVVTQKMDALRERRQRRDVDTGAGEVRDSGRKYRR